MKAKCRRGQWIGRALQGGCAVWRGSEGTQRDGGVAGGWKELSVATMANTAQRDIGTLPLLHIQTLVGAASLAGRATDSLTHSHTRQRPPTLRQQDSDLACSGAVHVSLIMLSPGTALIITSFLGLR
ncbi:hypothetical protein E2C01_002261 [Portunus trituberculatus]|uniref:Uncharacterized protein n=1 Tax=Portunus trituberculatus TaxID=210409 RepID=A0A5B7CLS8_PORTR|nr:hypothetical protein [Portunus trituberculatus]